MPQLTGQKAVAKHYGCEDRNVRFWMDDPDFPQPTGDKRNVYDTDAIDAWMATKPQMLLRRGAAVKSDGVTPEMGKANAALTLQLKQYKVQREKELALKAQREREAFEGTLLERRVWETFAAELLSGLADWCDQLPELLEGQIPKKYAAKARKWLEDQLNARRAQLADDLKRTPEGKSDK